MGPNFPPRGQIYLKEEEKGPSDGPARQPHQLLSNQFWLIVDRQVLLEQL